MGMNDTPLGERIRIGIFGCVNAGKSSVINAITSQSTSLVSEVPGTTTDPVSKTMELLPLGPVVITDTPGLDDDSILGSERMARTFEVLGRSDIALLVVDKNRGISSADSGIIEEFKKREIPFLVVYNKCDTCKEPSETEKKAPATFMDEIYNPPGSVVSDVYLAPEGVMRNVYTPGSPVGSQGQNVGSGAAVSVFVSALTGLGINELKEKISGMMVESEAPPVIKDLVKPGELILLVVPIDKAAPKGRLILPVQQTIRDAIEAGAHTVTVTEEQLEGFLNRGLRPDFVVTDSQVFEKVGKTVPEDIRLTSFSILMARHKGNLAAALEGAKKLKELRSLDTVVIAEGCTHHRQCGDIGTVKLPAWIREFTGAYPEFAFTSGNEFADEEKLRRAALVIHCGGCMQSEKEMKRRYAFARACGVPVTNYGIAIACMKGILDRAVRDVL